MLRKFQLQILILISKNTRILFREISLLKAQNNEIIC